MESISNNSSDMSVDSQIPANNLLMHKSGRDELELII